MEEQLLNMPVVTIVSGLLVGLIFGFILQRGRFCVNTAFRDVIFVKDFTMFRAYILALIVIVVGANLLEDMGYIFMLRRQEFAPVANILGGYVFGLGIVLAGGCGSGILYRTGEGLLAAWVAVFGFFTGVTMMLHGILNPLYGFLRSFRTSIADKPNAALWDIFGNIPVQFMGKDINLTKWIVIGALTLVAAIFILKGKPFSSGKSKGFSWSLAGLLVGLLGIAAWWISDYWGGGARGLSFTAPLKEAGLTIINGNADAKFDPMYLLGPFKTTWAALYVIGVPLGSYISAKILKEFKWKVPPAEELLTVLGGSVMMGAGAALAGGCNVGQGLTGASTLAVSSLTATIFIILGNWTMVYFKFIKPMAD
ncbi:MAG: YeeE/YedE family protein [Nitrospirae bacterium]|nr:YeeE/YedE family protein [Nitrospirota bacterium]